MPEHRNLSFQNFIESVQPSLLDQYFLRLLQWEQLPSGFTGMDPDYVLLLLDQVEEPVRAIVLEDFRRINDICQRDLGLPFVAAGRFDVPVMPEQKPQTTAMKLFLDHPRAFNFAWALYSYQASWGNISQHWLQRPEIKADSEHITSFANEQERFFADRNQGTECRVSFYDDDPKLLILVLHGSHIRTVTCWQGRELAMNSFRPACEDVLVYDKRRAVLSVKASGRADREHYVRSFAELVLGSESLADSPQRDLIYTLEPLREDSFAWSSSSNITAVELIEAKLRLPHPGPPVVIINGDGIDLSQGEVVAVKLRFTANENGKQESIVGTITPPCVTDLVKKRHAEVVCEYLRQKGILLR